MSNKGYYPIYLIQAIEPVQGQQAVKDIWGVLAQEGYNDKRIYEIDAGFNWDLLANELKSPSLFADKEVYELRLRGKLSKNAISSLQDFLENIAEGIVALIIADVVVDNKISRYISERGQVITTKNVTKNNWQYFIQSQFRRKSLIPDKELLYYFQEIYFNNINGALNAISILALSFSGKLAMSDAIEYLQPMQNFSVYDLCDAALKKDATRVVNIFNNIEDNSQLNIINWALSKEVSKIKDIWSLLQSGEDWAQITHKLNIWSQNSRTYQEYFRNFSNERIDILLQLCYKTDLIIKGQVKGNANAALLSLALYLAGKVTFTKEEIALCQHL